MTPEYRRLPGKRRGFLNVSSVWAGSDHLLLVRGSRFREEYKRFYYRDVQAIAVARAPRFQVSTVWAAIGLVWLAVFAFTQLNASMAVSSRAIYGKAAGAVCVLLALMWAYLSAAQSCRCRIYTAVSSDEFPSVYRIRTARNFLAAVEPLIAQVQGTIEGEWAAAAEERAVGPASAASAPLAASTASAAPRRALASDLFLLSLAADALAKLLALPAPLRNWFPFIMEMLTVVGAIGVIVQHNRGRLRAGIHRVAVASLIAFGVIYYVQSITVGMSQGMIAAKTGRRTVVTALPQSRLAQQAGAGIDAILVLVGLVVSLRD
jgi:hypothetical protein